MINFPPVHSTSTIVINPKISLTFHPFIRVQISLTREINSSSRPFARALIPLNQELVQQFTHSPGY